MSSTAKLAPLSSNPRDSQRRAADPAHSVWVNASAGSGKTTVLTDRVTRLLLADVAPEKILCLTYTRAGAAEMANRITGQFSKWAACDDATLDNDLDDLFGHKAGPKQRTKARQLFAEILSCPGGLRIRTIHSFCQEILRRFPIEAGLPPHFALIDEQETEILKTEILDDVLREAARDPGSLLAQSLTHLAADQGEHGFDKMLRDVAQARGRLQAAIDKAGGVEHLIAQLRRHLKLEPGDTPDNLRQAALVFTPGREQELRQMAAWLLQDSGKYPLRGARIIRMLDAPPENRLALFDDYLGLFQTQKFEPPADKTIASKKLRDAHPEMTTFSANETLRLQGFLERIEAAEIAELTAAVLHFGAVFSQRLAARKAARASVDYEDLILFTNRLLQRPDIAPWILFKLDNGIDHILVDEAQDTSAAQWQIVEALTAEFYAGKGARDDTLRTLFVVGDEKQSIFSFQNADPEKFLLLRGAFEKKFAAASKPLEKIGLHTSFRSAPAILKAVDDIFASEAARAGVSEEPVTHTASPNRDGSAKAGRVEVWPLLESEKDSAASDAWDIPAKYEEASDPEADLARQIARKIKTWLNKNEILPGMNRPVTPGDIMILLRRRGRFANLMVRALKAEKVAVTGVDRMHLIKQLPVMDLLAALRFVLLPEDDLNLATLLRSPLLGLSEDQLMQIAIGRKDGLWASLTEKAATDPALASAHDWLAARLGEADYSTPFAFLSHLLNAPCPANAASGRMAIWSRLGHEALDPLEELLNAAQRFGAMRAPSLQNFILWLTQADTEIKREMDKGDQTGGGQIRIMTVHASKGLEAPVVFLPDTASVPRNTDIPKFQWVDDIPVFIARTPHFPLASALRQQARARQMQEYRRLFYVALTRAANHLYICGWKPGKNAGDISGSWYNLAYAGLQPHHNEALRGEGTEAEIVIADAPLAPAKAAPQPVVAKPRAQLPSWATRPASTLAATAQPVSPATAFAASTPDAAFARGRIIHRLLQSLPDIAADKRTAATLRFLSHPRHNLDDAERNAIAQEVGNLLDDEKFAAFYGPDSRAEVPLAGRLHGAEAFRQVDRLCLRGEEVWVVDYKTNRPPPASAASIPEAYRLQLGEYSALLSGIYPDKKIRTFLLWTYAARLMEIDA
ncbi:MAG: double-strand break repair helicase AddA [Alphaproteobacteria bacterium]|nr:double-strand break repair helicase AddA [Alphaproteobacteria bacterium]